ncbi:uncharacterized membrane protein YgaE (UPF0421/DUF939 family) [Neomicrococcus aestuarii]|uniref:Uncharacterized membrane protein YgaE (UPF0421/DUF939 family) n=1 Tax=Neomicrococcus aestuarii TaxID=556325 RepID=A0A7W8TWA8_9MICC|nr:FUSC family protein [Neomicrococcus aestuarii]MBB5512686.1 uncharacterized membrane protein YgaE (UPF0421/DUF939 family) [Neomicrococcus aestuarii]
MEIENALGKAKGFTWRRTRAGLLRVRNSLPKIVQATICAVGAFWFAEVLLGHEGPIFAATSALIALGFGSDTHLRRTMEVAIGCTLGIAVGDILLTIFGQGLWQAGVVLFISLMLARFLDRGTIFSTQLGLQALLVVLLPPNADGVFGRSIDAIIGGVFALIIVALSPRDPRHEPVQELQKLLRELSGTLQDSAAALARLDSTGCWHALVRARATQPTMNKIPAALRAALELATINPVYRNRRNEINRLRRVSEGIDLAVRNTRVFTRRMASVISHDAISHESAELLAAYLEQVAEEVNLINRSISERTIPARMRAEHKAREGLTLAAGKLLPEKFHLSGVEGEGLVLLLRPFLVDLMSAAGIEHDEAVRYLPKL